MIFRVSQSLKRPLHLLKVCFEHRSISEMSSVIFRLGDIFSVIARIREVLKRLFFSKSFKPRRISGLSVMSTTVFQVRQSLKDRCSAGLSTEVSVQCLV